MSFVLGDESDAPALSLEDALALLDAVDNDKKQPQQRATATSNWCSGASNCSTSSSCVTSPALDDDLDLELLAASELSWPDAEDAASSDLATLLFSPTECEQTASSSEAAVSSTSVETTPHQPEKPNTQQQRRKRKATTAVPPSAKAAVGVSEPGRARKNAKTEILELRALAEELQTRLAQLQRRNGRTATVKRAESGALKRTRAGDNALALPMTSPVWLENAVDEFKALQKAEELNAKLKAEVKRQTSFSKTLQLLFSKKTAQLSVADYVLALAPPPGSGAFDRHLPSVASFPAVEQVESDSDSLVRRVESMHIEADTVRLKIAAESDFSSVFSSTRTKTDAAFGPVVELKTNTPVNHADYQQLARLLWARACQTEETFGAETVMQVHFTSEMYERPVWMKLPSPFGELVLNGVIVMCKVEEGDRSIITFASTVTVTSHPRVRFCEHGWMIAGEHESDATKCLFQTFYQVRAERRSAANGVGAALGFEESDDTLEDDVALRDSVMSSLAENMRAFYHEIQKMLHVKDKVAAIASFSRDCPLDNFKRLVLG